MIGEIDMKGLRSIVDNEKGSPLVIVLLITVLLTLIGMSVMNTSSTDLQMAGQHRRYTTAFYGADGGIQGLAYLFNSVSLGNMV